jgi:hypothetical protein
MIGWFETARILRFGESENLKIEPPGKKEFSNL